MALELIIGKKLYGILITLRPILSKNIKSTKKIKFSHQIKKNSTRYIKTSIKNQYIFY